MKLIIVNNSSEAVPAAGAVSVPAGSSLTQENRSISEYAGLVSRYVASNVQVHCELEDADQQPLICTQKTPADPGSGVGTIAAIGFDVLTFDGGAASVTDNMYLAVFSDAACTTLSTTATLDTAATGTIVSGAGTAVLLITPAGGVVSVTLTDTADETVYVKAWAAASGRSMDTSDVHDATFIA